MKRLPRSLHSLAMTGRAEQILILVDENDKFLGYAPRSICHSGRGKHHRAFVTLLFNSKGQVLLQRRKHKLFDGLWDFTAISHPLHLEENTGNSHPRGVQGSSQAHPGGEIAGHDETYQEASDRALLKEMGIKHVEITEAGGFNYFARDGGNCENEYCELLIGKYDKKFSRERTLPEVTARFHLSKIKPNYDEVYEVKWVDYEKFMEDINENPQKYTVWARKGTQILEKAKFSQGRTSKQGLTLLASLRRRSGPEYPPFDFAQGKQGETLFKEDLKQFNEEFEKYKEEYFRKLRRGKKGLQAQIYKEMERFARGGKGLRPYMLWLGFRLSQSRKSKSKEDLVKILPSCLAVELTHHFFLVHDDIIDKADTRRGKATIHKVFEQRVAGKRFYRPLKAGSRMTSVAGRDDREHYGASQAILVGDLYITEAIKAINGLELPHKVKSNFLNHWMQVVSDTITGEALDVQLSKEEPSLKEIITVTDLKTAWYTFAGPLIGGAILDGMESWGSIQSHAVLVASNATAGLKGSLGEKLQEFGMALGQGYQLRDDILGVFGQEDETGKSSLSDMRQGKRTLLYFQAKEVSKGEKLKALNSIWGNPKASQKDLQKVREIFEQSGALFVCEKQLSSLVKIAKDSINRITKEKTLQEILTGCCSYVYSRKT